MGKLEIEYETCVRCGGHGKLPNHRCGEILRGEREEAGLSRATVASAMDISEAYLGDLERGNRDWTNEKVDAFRQAVKELR